MSRGLHVVNRLSVKALYHVKSVFSLVKQNFTYRIKEQYSNSCAYSNGSEKSKEKNKDKISRPAGGGRPLIDQSKVFLFNNWDNVEWDEEQEEEAKKKVSANSQTLVDEEMQEKYDTEAGFFWDEFYNIHQNRFFKDRHWLFTEFPELLPLDNKKAKENVPERIIPASSEHSSTETENQTDEQTEQGDSAAGVTESEPIRDWTETELRSAPTNNTPISAIESFPGENSKIRIFEVGCGVGNTVFPVLQTNNDPGLFIYCCDLSKTAVDLVKAHEDYKQNRCHAFVCDVTDTRKVFPFPDDSLDVIILIFVLSAIHPDRMKRTIERFSRKLKPGGRIIFRDYGRYDLAQLRFKNGRCLSENFYVRGDGTRVYFFTQEELDDLFTGAGLVKEQNIIDRRLQVNRGRQLKMYRVWIQCKYSKPVSTGN